MTIVSCTDLTKFYGRDNFPAIDGLCLEIPEHCVFGFLGPNGAGKTTTIKILTGLMTPSRGTAVVAGELVTLNSKKLRSKIGYLGQEPRMYDWMRGKELLMFVGEIFGLSRKEREVQADKLLEISGLSYAANKRISSYSGGMLQRLGIAQALVSNPEVLFLDEPTSSLDPIGRKEVLEFIHQLKDETTVFISTHILTDVERVCDVVAIINKGKLVAEDSIEHLKSRFSSRILVVELETENDAKLLDNFLKIETKFKYRKEDFIFEIAGAADTDGRQEVMKVLYKNNLSFKRIELISPSLEDVFVSLVTDKN